MYYPCNENKGADQLRGYREADLRLCFHLCKLLVFSRGGSNVVHLYLLCRLMSLNNVENGLKMMMMMMIMMMMMMMIEERLIQ